MCSANVPEGFKSSSRASIVGSINSGELKAVHSAAFMALCNAFEMATRDGDSLVQLRDSGLCMGY